MKRTLLLQHPDGAWHATEFIYANELKHQSAIPDATTPIGELWCRLCGGAAESQLMACADHLVRLHLGFDPALGSRMIAYAGHPVDNSNLRFVTNLA